MQRLPTPRKLQKIIFVDDVTDNCAELSVKKVIPHSVDFDCFTWSFPHHFYHVVEGSKDVLYTDNFLWLPSKNHMKQTKVLNEGFQFSLAVLVPNCFFEESYSNKQMGNGNEYNGRHASVQAHARQII